MGKRNTRHKKCGSRTKHSRRNKTRTRVQKRRRVRGRKSRRKSMRQRGGYGKGGEFVGRHWDWCPSSWPGEQPGPTTNYYPYSKFGSPVGGSRIASSTRINPSKVQKGGLGAGTASLFLQDLVNGVRTMGHTLVGGYDTLQGVKESPNPLPYKGQYVRTTPVRTMPPDIAGAYINAGKVVSEGDKAF